MDKQYRTNSPETNSPKKRKLNIIHYNFKSEITQIEIKLSENKLRIFMMIKQYKRTNINDFFDGMVKNLLN